MKKYMIYALILVLPLFVMCSKSKRMEEQPNILFILTDDQKYNTINALGNPHIHTPNLDKIAEGGFVFTNAYCFGGNSGAVCIPSRNMVMSGKAYFRFVEDVRRKTVEGEEPRSPIYTNPQWASIPKSMSAADYETFYREKSGRANNPKVREQFDHYEDIHMVEALRTGRPAQSIVDHALEFLTTGRDSTKPFFIYLGLPCPHDPRWALREFRDLYDPDEIPLPPNYAPLHKMDIGDLTIRDEALEVWPRTEQAIKKHLHDYYSVISSMDFDLGRLLKGLEDLELTENTIIVFSSDQGLAIGDHGLLGKQNVYEGTMKVPLIFKGNGIPEGTSEALVYLHDLFPTFCEIAGTDIPPGLDGIGLLDIIFGKNKKVRDNLLLAYKEFQRSIRDQKWKLIRFPQIDETRLYDLENDPYELNNLAADPKYADLVTAMFKKLDSERNALGDSLDLFPGNYRPKEFTYPMEKVKTRWPAGGLAPGDPSYEEETQDEIRKKPRE